LEAGVSRLAVDTETTGVAFFDVPVIVTTAWVDWMDDNNVHTSFHTLPDDAEEVKYRIAEADELVFHNAKFDLQKLALAGILDPNNLDPLAVYDTECLAHLLDEHRRKGLKFLAREILGEETDEEDVIRKERRRLKLTKKDGYDKLPREVIEPYARKDAEFTIRLHDLLRPRVEASENLLRLLRLEQRLSFVLLRMENRGMGVKVEYVEEAAREYASKALTLEMAIRDRVGSESFNPNSPKQLTEAFAAIGIDLESTDKATLAGLDDPLAQQILDLRTLKKIHGTYLKAILDEQRDGILHPSYRQHGTRTGRMSSGEAER
jgi:DNA polymerase-1